MFVSYDTASVTVRDESNTDDFETHGVSEGP